MQPRQKTCTCRASQMVIGLRSKIPHSSYSSPRSARGPSFFEFTRKLTRGIPTESSSIVSDQFALHTKPITRLDSRRRCPRDLDCLPLFLVSEDATPSHVW